MNKFTLYLFILVFGFVSGILFWRTHIAEVTASAIQKADQKYQILKASHEDERKIMERQVALDNAKAESRLRKAIEENQQLRAEAAHIVSAEFLVYAGLLDSPDTLPDRFIPPTAPTETETSLAGTTSQEIYELISTLDNNIEQSNFRLAQLAEQAKACR